MTSKEYRQQYYQEHKEKWIRDTEEKKEAHRKAVSASAKRNRKNRSQYEQAFWMDKWEQYLWGQSKRRAKYAGLEHTIKVEDIVIPEYCPYFGIKLTKQLGSGHINSNASIDRIDNTIGYIPGNIQIISRLANSVKRDLSLEQLITFAEGVLSQHKPQLMSVEGGPV